MVYNYAIGKGVGKNFHHACILDSGGNQVPSKRVDQHEQSLRKLFNCYAANEAKTLVAVDQPNNIGVNVRYTTGLAMRQLSRIHAGKSKDAVRDAYITDYAGKYLPASLHLVNRVDQAFVQLKVLNGTEEALAGSCTRLTNQIRSALVRTNPGFEYEMPGQIIHRKWVLHLLANYGGPAKVNRLVTARINTFAAIASQSSQIAGAIYADLGVAMSTKDALLKLEHRKEVEAEVIELIEETPQTQLLLFMPGIGPRPAAQILMTAGHISDFPTAGHLESLRWSIATDEPTQDIDNVPFDQPRRRLNVLFAMMKNTNSTASPRPGVAAA